MKVVMLWRKSKASSLQPSYPFGGSVAVGPGVKLVGRKNKPTQRNAEKPKQAGLKGPAGIGRREGGNPENRQCDQAVVAIELHKAVVADVFR